MLGGSVGVQFSKSETDAPYSSDSKSTTVAVSPQFGVGLKKNWIIGAGVSYNYGKGVNESATNYQQQEANFMSVNLFVRKFHPFGDRLGIFGQADVSGGLGKQKGEGSQFDDYENKLSNYSVVAKPGLYFKPSKKLIIEAMFGYIGYSHTIYTPGSGTNETNDQFTFSLTNSLSLGFMVIL